MVMIFGVVVVGLFSAKRGLWSGEIDRKLSVFILNISMPALILASVMGEQLNFSNEELASLGVVAVVNYLILLLLAVVTTKIYRPVKSREGLMRFMLTFGNVSFIGFPVCDAVFGPKAVFCAAVLNIPFNLLIFTIGVSFINGGSVRQAFSPKLIFSPCVIASLIALIIALVKVPVPAPVGEWMHLLGDLTVPCALLIIGSNLSHIPWRDMLGNKFVYAVSFLRLLVQPLILAVIFRLIGIDPFVSSVAVVLSAMPIAANGIMLCLQYGKDERVTAQGIFITLLFAVVTIPLTALLTTFIV